MSGFPETQHLANERTIGEIIRQANNLAPEQIEEILSYQRTNGVRIGEAAVGGVCHPARERVQQREQRPALLARRSPVERCIDGGHAGARSGCGDARAATDAGAEHCSGQVPYIGTVRATG